MIINNFNNIFLLLNLIFIILYLKKKFIKYNILLNY